MTTIEDVDYLVKNSVQDTVSFFIDSEKRNKQFWPTPSEYSIEFDEPIRQVFGIEVLDASVPSTMYAVDDHNSRVGIVLFDAVPAGAVPANAAKDVAALFSKLPPVQALLSSTEAKTTYVKVVLDPQPDTAYAFAASSTSSYYVHVVRSFTSYANIQAGHVQTYRVEQGSFNQVSAPAFATPYWEFRNAVFPLTEGNYDVLSFYNALTETFTVQNTNLTLSPITGSIERQYRVKFTGTLFFFFNMGISSAAALMGFNTPAYYASTNDTTFTQMYIEGLSDRLNNFLFGAKLDTAENFVIIPPGVINLLGVRYATLRCTEIEQNYNSYTKVGKYSNGIAVFKLFNDFATTNVRFDFSNIVKKPFHPIGKLSRLTFRFERAEGVLYDFKGCDHHMLICVKYYAPAIKKPDTFVPVLNPDYNPDYIDYVTRVARFEGVEREMQQQLMRNYQDKELLQERFNYEYSSSEEDDDDDGYDDDSDSD